PMKRREFLTTTVGIATAIALPAVPQIAAKPRGRKLAIVGAGLAGLVAGYELKRRGFAVTIFEARDRPGGRVLTLREPFTGEQHAEAGAMFIPSSHDLVLKYAREFKLTLNPMPARALSPTLYLHGRKIAPQRPRGYDWPVELSPRERKLTLDEMAELYLGPPLDEIGDPRAPGWPRRALAKYDRVSFAQMLRDRGASPGAIELLRMNDADLIGDGVGSVSALMVLRENKFYETARQTFSLAGGSDRLPYAFAAQLKKELNYGCPAVKIDRTDRSVRLSVLRQGVAETTAFDQVICAVPLTVMDRIEFSPALPAALHDAQTATGYTSVTRVYLQTNGRPWDDTRFGISAYTDLPSMTLVNSTFDQPGANGILHSYMTGANARASAKLDEPGRAEAALGDTEKLFPGMRKSYARSASIAWDDEEWTRGAFAWFRPGQMFELRPRLAQPVDRLVFAGEHMSKYPGWMQGALESGLRAATEVARRR
ncbi:MAG: FAD-dependent oxidoreductase, partial [Pyrinomonadaceae bacterium]